MKKIILLSLIIGCIFNSCTSNKKQEANNARQEVVADSGEKFIDVSGFNLDGQRVSLSDYAGKGKVVLIDFWASWCGPCIRAMPELISIYNEYKDRGFEIVGISFDNNKESWKKATEDLNITWPQFSNLKGWAEDAGIPYGVQSIPNLVLIDKHGNIIERNLKGNALRAKLEELLGN